MRANYDLDIKIDEYIQRRIEKDTTPHKLYDTMRHTATRYERRYGGRFIVRFVLSRNKIKPRMQRKPGDIKAVRIIRVRLNHNDNNI